MSKSKKETIWDRIHDVMSEMEVITGQKDDIGEKELHELWRKRAESMAKPPEEGEEDLLWEKLIVLKVGKEIYSFRVKDVEEIMRVPPITMVPCVPAYFIGVINRRGSILPLVDLKVFFGYEKMAETRDSRVIVLSRNRLNLGFLVEAADKIISLPADKIKPPGKRGEGIHEEFCAGVITMGKQIVVLIDSLLLLQDQRLKIDKGF